MRKFILIDDVITLGICSQTNVQRVSL